MPRRTYKFAVERNSTGYTHGGERLLPLLGCQTFRHHRDFIEDGRPIWHYN